MHLAAVTASGGLTRRQRRNRDWNGVYGFNQNDSVDRDPVYDNRRRRMREHESGAPPAAVTGLTAPTPPPRHPPMSGTCVRHGVRRLDGARLAIPRRFRIRFDPRDPGALLNSAADLP